MINLSKALSTALVLSSVASAASVRDHLVSVQHSTVLFPFPPVIRQVHGSGICINHSCSVVATAYHVQLLAGAAKLGVAGGHTEKVLSLASDQDTDKTDVPVGTSTKTLSYNVANDISFIYTKKPLSHKSGISYSYKCFPGQEVQVAGYYEGKFETKAARIIGKNVTLAMGKGQLKEDLILDIYIDPRNSGSAVLDERGNLLGMIILTGALHFSSGDLKASVALPVRTIARALVQLDPALGSALFEGIPAEEPKPVQMAWAYQESDLPTDTSPVIPELSGIPDEVPNPVGQLRTKSGAASRRMVNLVSKQCLIQGTQKPLCHELAVVDGKQIFREIEKNGKRGKSAGSFPIQKHGVWPQADWNDTLGDIEDNPWVFQGSMDGYYVFAYRSTAEDDRCYFEEYPQGIPLFSGQHQPWSGSVACFEQVLTDKDFNVFSVFAEMHPPDGCLTQVIQTALYYDWVKLGGLKSPVLLPVRERISAQILGQKDLVYTSVSWSDYSKFRAEHVVRF